MPLPLPKAFWPLTIATGVNNWINVKVGATSYAATIAAATYYSPVDLLAAVQAALTAAIANGWAVTVDASQAGHVRVTGTAAFQLLFATGANAAASARDVLGFGAIDTIPGTSVVAPYQHQNGWYAEDPVVDDTGLLPYYDRAQTVSLGGVVKSVQWAMRYRREIALAHLREYKVFPLREGTHVNEAIGRLIDKGWARFRWWDDAAVEDYWVDLALDPETARALPRNRLSRAVARYDLVLKCLYYA